MKTDLKQNKQNHYLISKGRQNKNTGKCLNGEKNWRKLNRYRSWWNCKRKEANLYMIIFHSSSERIESIHRE